MDGDDSYWQDADFLDQLDKLTASATSKSQSLPGPTGLYISRDAVSSSGLASSGTTHSTSAPQGRQILPPKAEKPWQAGRQRQQYSHRSTSARQKQATHRAILELNAKQREAALAPVDKPLLIIAGPGSGKTKTVCCRILHVLSETSCAPQSVMAVTFTRNATQEMRDRIALVVGHETAQKLNICTFHSFCLRICREYCQHLGLSKSFSLLSRAQQVDLICEALVEFDERFGGKMRPELGILAPKLRALAERSSTSGCATDSKVKGPKYDKSLRRKAKQTLLILDREGANCKVSSEEMPSAELRFVHSYYRRRLREEDAIDFLSLIRLTVELLTTNGQARGKLQDRIKYVIVDEFQDTSRLQLQLLLKLVQPREAITVVGDDDQSIYAFNGANVENFQLYQSQFPNLQCVKLEQNYRSTKAIVRSVNTLIARNPCRVTKSSWTSNADGEPIVLRECRTTSCENAALLQELERLRASGVPYKDVAVLFRTKRVGKEIAAFLENHGIPTRAQNLQSFKSYEVQSVLSFLRLTVNPGDDHAVRQVIRALRLELPQETVSSLFLASRQCRVNLLEVVRHFCGMPRPADSAKLEIQVAITLSKKEKLRLKKMVELLDVLRRRAAEITLPEFIRRVLDQLPVINAGRFGRGTESSNSARGAATNENGENGDPSFAAMIVEEAEEFSADYEQRMAKADQGTENRDRRKIAMDRLQAFMDHFTILMQDRSQVERERSKGKKRSRGHVKMDAESQKDAVWLGTVHQSKGLEWKAVFVVRLNEGFFPVDDGNAVLGEDADEELLVALQQENSFIQEERRLAFVAFSRAQLHLFLSYVVYDEMNNQLLSSRFLRELPPDLINMEMRYTDLDGSTQPIIPRCHSGSISTAEVFVRCFPELYRPFAPRELGPPVGSVARITGFGIFPAIDGRHAPVADIKQEKQEMLPPAAGVQHFPDADVSLQLSSSEGIASEQKEPALKKVKLEPPRTGTDGAAARITVIKSENVLSASNMAEESAARRNPRKKRFLDEADIM